MANLHTEAHRVGYSHIHTHIADGSDDGTVVAERVKQTMAGAEPGRERQRKAQAAEEETAS